jgi:translation initiation factor IF-3
MNQEITANEIRVVTPNPGGKDIALGIMSRAEALAKAKELGGLDLILINNNSDPPVCKIVDYSKYRYSQEKKAKEVKKNSKTVEVKEIKMSYKIDVHDYDVRKKSASKFLTSGNRVKCTVMFRGREVQHDNLGFDLLEKLSAELEGVSLREGKAKREGRNLSLMLSPRPDVMKAISDSRRAEERAKKKKKDEEKAMELEQKKGKADESVLDAQNSALDDLLNNNS